jgi:hypothetical protein
LALNIDDIITEAEYNELGKLTYNQFKMYTTRLVKLCVEESLKALPSVITHLANHADYMKNLSNKFYNENKDLNNYRRLVSNIIQHVEANNPGRSYEDVLEEAKEKSRKVISMLKLKEDKDPRDLANFDSILRNL